MNNNQSDNASGAGNWMDIVEDKPKTEEGKAPGEKKVRKPLQLKKNADVFVQGSGANDLEVLFKEEIEMMLKKNVSGKMLANMSDFTIVEFGNNTMTAAEKKKMEQAKKNAFPETTSSKEESKDKEEKKPKTFNKMKGLVNKKIVAKKDIIDIESVLKDPTKFDLIPDETKAPLNIVFIGHVDAGKSTICGNILLLTGKVDQNELRKLEILAKEKKRESWYLAYIMDINEEEQAKGKTVEVGKAMFSLPKKRFTLLDAPGHKNYVPNMISGAAQADVACLVISAKQGEFESGFEKGGQTREHAMLARSLGVSEIVVAINKMDEASVGWSEKRFTQIKDQVSAFLKNQCGYNTDKCVRWVPISGLMGDNIMQPVDPVKCSWYKGPPFMQILDDLPTPKRDEKGPIRMPIMDKFKEAGFFVFGKVESGTIITGMNLAIVPSADEVQIMGIYNSEDKKIPYAKPGENVKVMLKGIEDENLTRGDILCSIDNFPQVCQEFEAQLSVLELPEHKLVMSSGYSCVIHLHALLEEVIISEVKAEVDRKTKVKKVATYLKAGSQGIVRITTKNALCCEKYETMQQLGRFTLRDEGRTIATGKITKIRSVLKD
jgi:peptide chain release factor subunit 3